ncbi:hypothetical protein M501DRAFT_1017143 [Patellaria atrata CBS 101060]|uniref:Rhodopsin domain-containing protein n=1 Tax=Patellaria atrata CBS 101060 TaxID=1346257 RepID=A0A9P4SAC9_9PEZI|nr:hypothetical protein M501DRAFT_1017143 [Patellaria atrata CBS 101060]
MTISEVSAPFVRPSPDNQAAWVIVLSSVLMIFSLICIVAKVVYRFRFVRLPVYDILLIVSMLFALVQTVCIIAACKNGLGRRRKEVSREDFERYGKFLYASQLLHTASLAFSKSSVVHFITVLSPQLGVQRICHGTYAIITLWATTGIIALAAQCKPRPWDYEGGSCINQKALYTELGIVNILIDVLLVGLPVYMLWDVHTDRKTKVGIITHFAIRIFIPVFTILYIISLNPLFDADPSARTWRMKTPTIWNQVIMNLSILTATLPSLKHVLDQLRAGVAKSTVSHFELSGRGSTSRDRSKRRSTTLQDSSKKSKGKDSILSTVTTTMTKASATFKRMSGTEILSSESGSDTDRRFRSQSIFSQDKLKLRPDIAESRAEVERSESIQGLTEDVIYQKVEFDVRHHDIEAATTKSMDVQGNRNGDEIRTP